MNKTIYKDPCFDIGEGLHVYLDDDNYVCIEVKEERGHLHNYASIPLTDVLRAAGAIVDEGVGDEDGEPGIDYERRCAELETVITELVKTVSTLTAMMKPVVFVAEDEDKVAHIKKFLNENALDI